MKLLCAQPILARTPLLARLHSAPVLPCLPARLVCRTLSSRASLVYLLSVARRGVAPFSRIPSSCAENCFPLCFFVPFAHCSWCGCCLPSCVCCCVCVSVCACCSLYDLQLCRAAVCAMLIECALLPVGQPSVRTAHSPHSSHSPLSRIRPRPTVPRLVSPSVG